MIEIRAAVYSWEQRAEAFCKTPSVSGSGGLLKACVLLYEFWDLQAALQVNINKGRRYELSRELARQLDRRLGREKGRIAKAFYPSKN